MTAGPKRSIADAAHRAQLAVENLFALSITGPKLVVAIMQRAVAIARKHDMMAYGAVFAAVAEEIIHPHTWRQTGVS